MSLIRFWTVALVLVIVASPLACLKQPGGSSIAAVENKPSSEDCQLDINLLNGLPNDCRRRIIEQFSLRDLFKFLPVSNTHLQQIVKQRVIGYWPKWFLEQIKKDNPGKFDESLAMYYLGFLKLPSVLSKRSNLAKFVDLHEMIKSPAKANFQNIKVGTVGDHHVAYYNRITGELGIHDTLSHKTIGKAHIALNQDFERLRWPQSYILRLGNDTFLLVTRQEVHARSNSQVIVWQWNADTGSLKQIHEIHSLGIDKLGWLQEQIFRVSDDTFVTLRGVGSSTFDFWTLGSSVSVKTVTVDDSQNINRIRSLGKQAVVNCLEKLTKSGVPIDKRSLLHPVWGLGVQIDNETMLHLSSERDGMFLSSLNYSKTIALGDPFVAHQKMPMNPYQSTLEGAITKNGDYIAEDVSPMGFVYTNIWKILDKYVKESLGQRHCNTR